MGTLINRGKRSGKIITECSIKTPEGVKVADVAWLSHQEGVITYFSHGGQLEKSKEI
jgi:hypothetical protein